MSNFDVKFVPENVVDGYAIQALAAGKATEDQQKRAFNCIVKEICGTYKMTFDPESDRVSNFNEGARHVGRVLVGLITLNLGEVKKNDERKESQQTGVKVTRKRGK